jgi:hypothetical protein
MVIDHFFIQYKQPVQYIYWGEDYLDVYKVSDPNKGFIKTHTFDHVSLSAVNASEFQDIARVLLDVDTGIILNSGPFIFNIFEFEKVPWQEGLKKELVEWRVKKVFPENIADYEHDFFKLDKKRILSILFKKSLKEHIENLFQENDISLTYMGNSTVEMINHIVKLKKAPPDFFIEMDKTLFIIVFLGQGLPYYFRKFRADQTADIVSEVEKTINFVKNSYSRVPRTCSLMIRHSDLELQTVYDELSRMEILPLDLKNNERFIFPGKE